MNRNVNIHEIAGFFIPVNCGCVEKVTCQWSDSDMYEICSESFNQDSYMEELIRITELQNTYQPCSTSNGHTIPIDQSYVRKRWGEDAVQLRSGSSAVILSPSKQVVYKRPLVAKEMETLADYNTERTTCSLASFPIGRDKIPGEAVFFKFELLQSPITRDLAKIDIIEFVPKVAKAIKALHAIGIAHLDIRLENVFVSEMEMQY